MKAFGTVVRDVNVQASSSQGGAGDKKGQRGRGQKDADQYSIGRTEYNRIILFSNQGPYI